MFTKVLIANRGEIACRVIRTLKKMGVGSVAVYSEADAAARHVLLADEAVCLGPAAPAQSYLDVDKVLKAAIDTGAQAIHPGYGFLSENAAFAVACEEHSIAFIGPTAAQIRAFGLKHTARSLAEINQVPLVPGTELLASVDEAVNAAQTLDYPIILKATAGGGGIGMRVCQNEAELREHFEAVRRLGEQNFADAGIYLERFITTARHVEVQIFGDGKGKVVALGERDCSLQRRNQKVVEETPAPNLPERVRQTLCEAAVRLAASQNYRSAGTVEFVYDAEREEASFLEVNTRLQVEHGVTEQVTGVDLVEWMIRCAAGDTDFLDTYKHAPKGHAIQVRVYAEDANKDFQPSAGILTNVEYPTLPGVPGVRVDDWITAGTEVSPYYDPLLSKVMVTADTRDAAIAAMQSALDQTRLDGIETNLTYLRQVVRDEAFITGMVNTKRLGGLVYTPPTIDVIAGGNFTTVQDAPGRVGYWGIGVPPSGPMDDKSFREGNALLGNEEGEAGLEMTAAGPTLKFNTAATVSLTGADMQATLDGNPLDRYSPVQINAGQSLKLGRIKGPGLRSYLLIQGGLDLPEYLGSKATFTLGEFGGHAGRTLRAGDVLHVNQSAGAISAPAKPLSTAPYPAELKPDAPKHWAIGVLEGPHSTQEFFLPEDIETIFSTDYEVHYNSSRTGVRLIGPKPTWARTDGGEAGLHPSNIHDNAYAIGALDFTGDMPIILGPDGPSLGGFVCPVCIVKDELWKMGQLTPGDTVRFVHASPAPLPGELSAQQTEGVARETDGARATQSPTDSQVTPSVAARQLPPEGSGCSAITPQDAAIVHTLEATQTTPVINYRRQGDTYLLIEYGPLKLDIDLRCRVQAVFLKFRAMNLAGVIDLTPGIRSLQVHYNPDDLPLPALLGTLVELEGTIPDLDDLEFPSRTVRLPLSYDDPAIHETIAKYIQSVRDDAPWCPKDNPSNIEFIRRANGLDSIDEVEKIVFDATYLVYGLGDVYLGAPVAVPLDPRQRLVTTKYNPARTWTPPNVVGIGGAYLCIYGMEGPGGYQLFGRTVPVWNTYNQTDNFIDNKPWLLRLFDQIQFYPVSHDELMAWRRDVVTGQRTLEIKETTFELKDYHAWLKTIEAETTTFREKRETAFETERQAWVASGEFEKVAKLTEETGPPEDEAAVELTGDQILVESPLTANVWKVTCEEGDTLEADGNLAILEAMKMETAIPTPGSSGASWKVVKVLCSPGQMVKPGTPLFVIEPS